MLVRGSRTIHSITSDGKFKRKVPGNIPKMEKVYQLLESNFLFVQLIVNIIFI